ncbi:uncharacterized protein LOC103967468 isoform X2 [Pyrus x bretschneideri]|uniref:uncharacterized protein LOC103967468 isoform X2 n=1 Tax=Pyrus x bretschneideri TaxID=225117 RepID=UPI002030BC18|nr:uncharacterized protein LOC103967468 isoform X2 [Pyrus x bretschneideri]
MGGFACCHWCTVWSLIQWFEVRETKNWAPSTSYSTTLAETRVGKGRRLNLCVLVNWERKIGGKAELFHLLPQISRALSQAQNPSLRKRIKFVSRFSFSHVFFFNSELNFRSSSNFQFNSKKMLPRKARVSWYKEWCGL